MARTHAARRESTANRGAKDSSSLREIILAMGRSRAYLRPRPISHVPVAVCRSVGIRTRGRTAARSEIAKTSGRKPGGRHGRSSENIDRQPEAKPAHLVLHEGRGLKQRRSGLLRSRRLFHQSVSGHRRGLFIHCQQCGAGSPQSKPRQLERF